MSSSGFKLKLTLNEPESSEAQKPNRKKSKYYYKVANHHELFKLGRSFNRDFEMGVKSFAIASTGYKTSQQKTILGLASYFDHHYDIKIAIVSDQIDNQVFLEAYTHSNKNELYLDSDGTTFTVYSFYDHFDFVNMKELLDLQSLKDKEGDSSDILKQFIDQYDIIFWDVPELHHLKSDIELYSPMLLYFDCMSVIVSESNTKLKNIENVKTFFSCYDIKLKGLILDSTE